MNEEGNTNNATNARLKYNCIFKEIRPFYTKHANNFKIAHININSIRNKFEPFREVLIENIFDVLSIQESKLDESFPAKQFDIDTYKCYRKDYKNNEGGLMMFIRNDMAQHRRRDIETHSFNDEHGRIEIMAVEVSIQKDKWLFVSLYKQPKVHVSLLSNCIDGIMHECGLEKYTLVILGDTNINMLKHNPFVDCLDVNGLKNIIKAPTWFKGQPTLIDLIITNKPKRFLPSICIDTGLSDFHNIICVGTKLHVPKKEVTTITFRSYKHFNQNDYLQDLSNAPFHVSEIFDDVDDSYWYWSTLLNEVVNEHAPIKLKTIKCNRLTYMNGELRRAINVKHMLKRKFETCNSQQNWETYRKQRNLVTKNIQTYMQKRCMEGNPQRGEFWNTVKPLISNKVTNKNDNIFINDGGTIENNPGKLCTLFNNYFTSIACEIGPNDSLCYNDNVDSCIIKHNEHTSVKQIRDSMRRLGTSNVRTEFKFCQIDTGTLKNHLRCMKLNKAAGHDMLPAKLLKLGSDILCLSMTYLMNMCFSSGTFPCNLKCADVCPIFKKGDTMEIANYRPISILPSVSKIF